MLPETALDMKLWWSTSVAHPANRCTKALSAFHSAQRCRRAEKLYSAQRCQRAEKLLMACAAVIFSRPSVSAITVAKPASRFSVMAIVSSKDDS